MDLSRTLRHLGTTHRATAQRFPEELLRRLQAAITAGEATHRGEVRLIVEAAMPLRKVRRGLTTRQRALDLFGTFRVWDTEENNGVLLYVNVADRRIEVIADRAAARAIGDAHWQAVCAMASDAFRAERFEQGVTDALEAIRSALAAAFPLQAGHDPRRELGDEPVVI